MTQVDPARFGFGSLMPNLIQNVLMVASPYDCFMLEEEGKFSDRMFDEYAKLDLASAPQFEHVTSGKAALSLLQKKTFDLILTTPHCLDMSPERLAARVAAKYKIPVVMLTYDRAEAQKYVRDQDPFERLRVFVWNGDPKLLVAMVKNVEDHLNVKHDTHKGMVRVILIVEDSPSDYSEILPAMYRQLLAQLQRLTPDRLNSRDRHNRMRARPKILLARSFEEGMSFLRRYHPYLLGVISDIRFPRQSVLRERAGVSLIRQVHKKRPGAPVLLQSREAQAQDLAEQLNTFWVDKRSPGFLKAIREFMETQFGFGDFVFRLDGEEVARARDMPELIEALKSVPARSLAFHAEQNHISNWLFARAEFRLGMKIQPRNVNEFENIEAVRDYFVETFTEFLERRQRGKIVDFSGRASLLDRDFTRIGSGSMGGKARGVAFVSHLLAETDLHERYPEIRIIAPRSAVICTDYFDRYCEKNHLAEKAMEAKTDEEVDRLFIDHPFDSELNAILTRIVTEVSYPLAVRSSSLLEDSGFQPLAGLYKTVMLPNLAPSKEVRVAQLSRAVRLVVASAYSKGAGKYLEAHGLRPEQEKMAVLIQRLVGRRFSDRFYPDFAGVAQSFNYYPLGHTNPEDGIVTLALGLGRTVVEGGKAYRVCLKHPHIRPPHATPVEAVKASQSSFYALDLSRPEALPGLGSATNLKSHDLATAEKDGVLESVGATFSPANNKIYDTIYREGARLVNFAGVLQHDRFPLPDLLSEIMNLCREGLGGPVELEFAVALARNGQPAEMALLELRPLVDMGSDREVNLEEHKKRGRSILESRALGNGVIGNLYDLVYIHPERFDLSKSLEITKVIEKLNHRLVSANRPYILMGPGRWGSADRWLGIPVIWNQVSGARVIAELELPELRVDPSQGTHFFHNLISLRVGYFTVNLWGGSHKLDLEWLEGQTVVEEALGVRHVALEKGLEARIDGRTGRGVIIQLR